MRVSNYSAFVTHVSALIGVDQADFQTTELTFLNTFFNKAVRKIWETNNWTDLCPYGEVRFPLNLVTYPSDLTQANWTINSLTLPGTVTNNPLDNRVTAQSVFAPSSVTPATHSYAQTFQALPSTSYAASGYARPNGAGYIIVSLNDGTTSYTGSFNLVAGSATSLTTSSGMTVGIQHQANGFSYWSLSATSASSAFTTGSLTVNLSLDGVTTSFASTTLPGIYTWGVTLGTPNSTLPAAYYIPWEQLGESAIDVMFEVWSSDPGSFLPPYRMDYKVTPNGIELIGPTSTGPVYLYYRLRRPLFSGANYSVSTAYATGQSFYYTSTVTGQGNYYTVVSPSTAGQTPDSNPALFSQVVLPYIFFEYAVYSAYADWLEVEGQSAKAQGMRSVAETFIEDETDRQERQQSNVMPWRVSTHLTSQNRGLGYVGQNFNAGTATIN